MAADLPVSALNTAAAVHDGSELTPMQRAFCEALVVDGLRPADAAARAGYAASCARVTAYKLMRDASVAGYVLYLYASRCVVAGIEAQAELERQMRLSRDPQVRFMAARVLAERSLSLLGAGNGGKRGRRFDIDV